MSADEIKNWTVYMLCRTDKTEDDGVDVYVGSTSQRLERRLCGHRSRARKFIEYGCSENNKLYTRMVTCGVMNWKILPLLTFSCDQKTIFEFEREWIKATGASLNTISPVTNQKKYQAEYRENNKKLLNQRLFDIHKKNIRSKKFYCDVCDLACVSNFDLKKHFGTLKHSYAWLNAVD